MPEGGTKDLRLDAENQVLKTAEERFILASDIPTRTETTTLNSSALGFNPKIPGATVQEKTCKNFIRFPPMAETQEEQWRKPTAIF